MISIESEDSGLPNSASEKTKSLGVVNAQIEDILDPSITKMIIEEETIASKNISSGQIFHTKLLHLARSRIDSPSGYHELRNLTRTQKLRIFFRKDGELFLVDLPQEMLTNIARFIREEPEFQSNGVFDCISFAYLANGMTIPEQFEYFRLSDWDREIYFNEEDLHPGDTVLLEQAGKWGDFLSGHVTHFAIYLGSGLYISKSGKIGRLIVANMEEMKKGFGGNYCLRIKPRR